MICYTSIDICINSFKSTPLGNERTVGQCKGPEGQKNISPVSETVGNEVRELGGGQWGLELGPRKGAVSKQKHKVAPCYPHSHG